MITGPVTVLRPAAQAVPAGPGLVAGPAGQSAYALALAQGFSGDLAAWLASLVGPPGVGSPGAPGTTLAAGLTDVVPALKAVLTAADLPTARTAFGLGSAATYAAPDLPVSTATGATIAAEVARAQGVEATLAPKARQVTGGGLATGGGDLSADRVISVPKASQTDVAAGTDDAKALTSYAVAARFGLIAPLASPAFTGTPSAPTAATDTNTAQIATAAFVLGQAAAAAPAMDGTAAVGTATRFARADHVHPTDTSRVPTSRQVIAGTGLAGGGALGSDVTVNFAAIPTLTLLANAGGASAVPASITLSALLDAAIATGRGTILVRASSGWAPLALGANGTTLQSNGTDVIYAAASPGTGAVRYDTAQSLSLPQQLQERQNTGARGAGVLAKSAAYTVATTDAGRLLACTGAFALTLPSASTAGNGFAVEIRNEGTGLLTLTPQSADAINAGAAGAAVTVYGGEGCTLYCDGTGWRTFGLQQVVLAETIASTYAIRKWSRGLIQMRGTTVVTTSAAGVGTISLPLAFPNAQIAPQVCNGDQNAGSSASNPFSVVGPSGGAYPLNSIQFLVPSNANQGLRVNWSTEGY